MSTQPVRPGVRRPGAPATQPTTTSRPGQPSLEELRNLPAFVEDGANVDLDPEHASSGKMVEETATIVAAKFAIQDWKRKDGSYPETSFPEVQLQVFYKREGDDADARPYQENYRYGNTAIFAPSKDGNIVKVRPNVVKEGGNVPTPRKTEPATLFLQSIKNAGGGNIIEKMKAEGAKALVGLRVSVRSQKFSGQNEKAKSVLAVDAIEGVVPVQQQAPAKVAVPAPAQTAAAAPVAETAAPAVVTVTNDGNAVNALAEEALLDILAAAEGNSITRAQIPTTLIRIEKWKSHEQRGAILKALREDAVINRTGAPWKVEGNTLSL